MINVKIWKNPELQKTFDEAKEAALQGMGLHMSDAIARNTHRQTGTLQNSWNSKTKKWQSGFGSFPLENPKIILGEQEEVSTPAADRVRTGSALNYAAPYNDKFAVLETTADKENRNLGTIASAPFTKIIGK